ncbi:uncharacterized mitochondrial protein-like protein, partial [Tanacetum coccineum]
PNAVGSGLDWLFDIDVLTRIMNYEPIVVDPKSSHDDGSKPISDDGKMVDEDPRKESECNDQEKEDNVNSTNNVNVAGTNKMMKIGGAVADMNNLDTTIQEEPKNVIHALKDPRWIEAMQEELQQFKLQEVWTLIEEEVYVCQPLGFEDSDFPDRVYKVDKAFYGLHQAPRAWYETLSTYLLDNGFQRGKIEKNLFIKRHKEVRTASIPTETQKPLLKDEDGEEVDVHMYRSIIGSLIYLTSSRPDIMFTVCACARYQVNPKVSHLHAMKRIFRYLKGQPKLGLWYLKDFAFDLIAYTDSDYAGARLDRKSTTGGCQFLGCRLISWQCKK